MLCTWQIPNITYFFSKAFNTDFFKPFFFLENGHLPLLSLSTEIGLYLKCLLLKQKSLVMVQHMYKRVEFASQRRNAHFNIGSLYSLIDISVLMLVNLINGKSFCFRKFDKGRHQKTTYQPFYYSLDIPGC